MTGRKRMKHSAQDYKNRAADFEVMGLYERSISNFTHDAKQAHRASQLLTAAERLHKKAEKMGWKRTKY